MKMVNYAAHAEMLLELVASEVQLLDKAHSSQADQRDKVTAAKILMTEMKKVRVSLVWVFFLKSIVFYFIVKCKCLLTEISEGGGGAEKQLRHERER